MQDAHVSMAMDNKQNMEQRELQYYATVRKPMPSPIRDISTLERIPGMFADVSLYRFHPLPLYPPTAASDTRPFVKFCHCP
jgi:hypothetical protein